MNEQWSNLFISFFTFFHLNQEITLPLLVLKIVQDENLQKCARGCVCLVDLALLVQVLGPTILMFEIEVFVPV